MSGQGFEEDFTNLTFPQLSNVIGRYVSLCDMNNKNTVTIYLDKVRLPMGI